MLAYLLNGFFTAFGPYALNIRANISLYGPQSRLIKVWYKTGCVVNNKCFTISTKNETLLTLYCDQLNMIKTLNTLKKS